MEIVSAKLEQIKQSFVEPYSVCTRNNDKLYLQSLMLYGQIRPLVVMRADHNFLGDKNELPCYMLVDGFKMMTLLKQLGHRSFSVYCLDEIGTIENAIKAHLRINLSVGEVDLLKLVDYVSRLAEKHNTKQISSLLCIDEDRVKLLHRLENFDWDSFADKTVNVNQTTLF